MSHARPVRAAVASVPLVSLVLGYGLVNGTTPAAAATSTTYTSVADAAVREDMADTNLGSAITLRADGSPRAESYVRFQVGALPAPVSRAILQVYSLSTSDTGVAARPVTGPWSESSVTWNSRPTIGAIIARTGATREGQWASIDVTSLVTSGATLDLALTSTAGASRSLRSREGGATAPRLVIETAEAPVVTPPPPATAAAPVLAAAGDIACDPNSTNFGGGLGANGLCQQMATSDLLLDDDVSHVVTLGDNQYEDARTSAFLASYDPSWGRVKAKTRPAIGNHEYRTSGASGYFGYFGTAAGDPAKGYYSYDVGEWHVVALNSNCAIVSCAAGSAQERWLRADLAAHPRRCTLAYWHHPRFSSGSHGNSTAVQPLYQALYDAGAEVVLAGHDHSYERFARQTPAGQADPTQGVRSFVVGTGGKNHYPFGTVKPHSEVRDGASHGVLKLTLRPDGYDWRFEQAETRAVRDAGSDVCR